MGKATGQSPFRRLAERVFITLGTPIAYFSLQHWYLTQGILQRPWCTKDYLDIDCNCDAGRRAARNDTTGLKVVLPSYGQTGTSSVTEALRHFGLRTYHADDFSVIAKPVMFENVDWKFWAYTVSRCRMEAISLEPATDMLPLVMAKAPNAKVILTWRSWPAWGKSTTKARQKEIRVELIMRDLVRGNNWFPWIEWLDGLTGIVENHRRQGNPFFGDFTWTYYIYRIICNGYGWPITQHTERGTYKNRGSEEAYLAHQDEIRKSVPKERLLVFDIKKHGWAELEEFLFGTKSSFNRGKFPQPRSGNMRTNEPLMENNWRITAPAYFFLCVGHTLNFFIVLIGMHVLVFLLSPFLAACCGSSASASPKVAVTRPDPAALPPPRASRKAPLAAGVGSRWASALEACPVLATLDGVEPQEVVAVGQAVAEAGVRILAVPLPAKGALESLQALVKAAPSGTVVGASGVLTEAQVIEAHEAGATFVTSPNMDASVIQCTKSLGLASLPGVGTPSEALAALGLGADGLSAFPAEQLSPTFVKAVRAVLPKGTLVVITAGVGAPKDMAGYWAAGASGFSACGAELFRLGDTPAKIKEKAATFLKACLAAKPGAAR